MRLKLLQLLLQTLLLPALLCWWKMVRMGPTWSLLLLPAENGVQTKLLMLVLQVVGVGVRVVAQVGRYGCFI
jgi:hypothetical protein